jgi:hypothetical protein
MLIKPKRRPAADDVPRGSRLEVGSHIDAACTKCKSITSHIVIAKLESLPTRVECRTCSSLHAYRSPRRVSKAPAPRAEVRSPEVIWQDAMRRARGVSVPYSTRDNYAVGTRLNHSSFGEGVVARLASTTVCEVLFETGSVKLLMGTWRGA